MEDFSNSGTLAILERHAELPVPYRCYQNHLLTCTAQHARQMLINLMWHGRKLKKEDLLLLKSREIIAINQDPLGVAGDRVWKQGPYEVSYSFIQLPLQWQALHRGTIARPLITYSLGGH